MRAHGSLQRVAMADELALVINRTNRSNCFVDSPKLHW
jgi:hypothetical protein